MSTPSTYRLTRLNRFAPEQMAQVVSQSDFEHFLFESAPCDFVHEHWTYGELDMDRTRYGFGAWVRGQFRPDRVCIGFLRDLETPSWINGAVVGADEVQVYAEGADFACRGYRNAHWAVVQMARQDLQKAAEGLLDKKLPLPDSGMLNLRPAPEWRRNVCAAFDLCGELFHKGGALADDCAALLRRTVVHAIASADPIRAVQETKRSAQALHMVKLAELYLVTHLSAGYSSEEFARAVGMSERNLEIQFKKIFGVGPKKWRQYVCLNIAHRKLAHTAPRPGMVAEIASDCGFAHPSRFSAVYRELFGELPIRTRRDGRGE